MTRAGQASPLPRDRLVTVVCSGCEKAVNGVEHRHSGVYHVVHDARITRRRRCPVLIEQFGLTAAIIDDDSGFVTVVGKRMRDSGFSYRHLESCPPLDELAAMRLNVILLDVERLGRHGWELLERIGAMMPTLGIVVCTVQSSVAQRVRGLRLGADDWITKPCHPEEVVARSEAVVRRGRRAQRAEDASPFVSGELEFRPDRFQVMVAGDPLDLTRREFELLFLLAESNGRVLQRDDIYQRIWGYSMMRGDRSVDVFVRKLRQKLDRSSPGWVYIHTHFGIGYRFAAESRVAGASGDPEPAGEHEHERGHAHEHDLAPVVELAVIEARR